MIGKYRKMAADILEEIEDLLQKKGVYIPSEDRTGSEDEACLYGTEYYELEDKITEILTTEC